MPDAKIIRFPVERRQAAVAAAAVPAGSVTVSGNVTITGGSFAASLDGATPPAWWSKIPPITSAGNDRNAWMKLGPKPALRAKRHRVIALQVEASPVRMVALTACGRHMEVGILFGDPWSGGDCRTCRSKGWT